MQKKIITIKKKYHLYMILKYSAFKSFRLFDEQNSHFDGNRIIFFFKKNCKPSSLYLSTSTHVHSDLKSEFFFFLNQILEVHAKRPQRNLMRE